MVVLLGELISGEGGDTRHALASAAFLALVALAALTIFWPEASRGVTSGESFAGRFLP